MNKFFLFLSLILSFGSIWLYSQGRDYTREWLVMSLWLVSMVILIFPLVCNSKFWGVKKYFSIHCKEIVLLGLILVGAALVRFYRIEEIPILGHDEARDAGLLPEAFLRGEIKDFFGQGIYGIPNLFFILGSIPHLLFPRTVLAVKFFAAFFGVFSVLATYLLARKLFNREIAIISGVLLSFYHVHLHFSRSEFINLFDSFWAPFLVLGLILAIEKDSFFSLFLGLIAGVSLHFYQGIRAIVGVSVFYFFFYLIFKQRRFLFQKIFLTIFGFLIGFGPSLVVLLNRPAEFFNTGNAGKPVILDKSFFELIKILPDRLFQSFGSIFYFPIDFHYRFGGPFLQLPFSIFFFVGILLIFKNISKTRYNFLLFWITSVILLNSTILVNTNFTHRLLSLIPALMIVTALGIYQTIKFFEKFNKALVLGVLLYWILINIKLYFFDSVWKKALYINTKVATTAGSFVRQFPKTTKIYFLNSPRMNWKGVPSWEYLNEEYTIEDLNEADFPAKILAIQQTRQDKVFIILPERKGDLSFIREAFPKCESREFFFDKELLFYGYQCRDEK